MLGRSWTLLSGELNCPSGFALTGKYFDMKIGISVELHALKIDLVGGRVDVSLGATADFSFDINLALKMSTLSFEKGSVTFVGRKKEVDAEEVQAFAEHVGGYLGRLHTSAEKLSGRASKCGTGLQNIRNAFVKIETSVADEKIALNANVSAVNDLKADGEDIKAIGVEADAKAESNDIKLENAKLAGATDDISETKLAIPAVDNNLSATSVAVSNLDGEGGNVVSLNV